MNIYLGLGSNLRDPKSNLERAVNRLKEDLSPSLLRVSPLYQAPALLPKDADPTWNKPFLNMAIELVSDISPEDLLDKTQKIEQDAGRTNSPKWAPRVLDVDILLYGNSSVQSEHLTIPHPEVSKRAFVLDPLKDLNLNLQLPGERESVLNLARKHSQHAPIWMGIINITPDSFSDGNRLDGEEAIQNEIDHFDELNIGIIDIGAESTRPGAVPVTPEQEWSRLKPILRLLQEKFKSRRLRPLISVDTRHFETTIKAIEYGVDILNDVSGLADKRFIDTLKNNNCSYVLTHSLTIPAHPDRVIFQNADVMAEIKRWFSEKIELLISQGIQKERIIIDPGIGFGKTSLQSQVILQDIHELFDFNLRVLVGHSRKSFLKSFASAQPQARDIESVGVSLALINKGIDILRVHNPIAHIQAFQGWSHVRSNT